MPGYFRQLAAQALRPSSRLHPLSASPYRSEALTQSDWPTLPDATRTPQLNTQSIAPAARHAERPDISANAPPMRPLSEHSKDAPDAVVGRAPDAQREITIVVDEPAHERARDDTPELAAASSQTSVSAPRTSASAPRMESARREPLRRETVPRGVPPSARARALGERSTSQEPPAPEVHIHIGRIELTALPPVSEPKRPTAPVRKAMSLDDYLRKKAGQIS